MLDQRPIVGPKTCAGVDFGQDRASFAPAYGMIFSFLNGFKKFATEPKTHLEVRAEDDVILTSTRLPARLNKSETMENASNG